MKRILTNKLFLAGFAADMVSNFGDILYYLAMANYVLHLPQMELALAIVILSETLPILAGLFSGLWADRTKNKLAGIVGTGLVRVGLYSLIGLLMGLEPALWIVLVVAVFNFLSDVAGQYENGLHLPISLRIVAREDREAAAAFRMSVESFLRIFFQAASAVLVGLFSYQQLAFINAGTFFVSLVIFLLIRPALSRLLVADPIQQTESPATGGLSSLKKSLSETYRVIDEIPVLKSSIVLIAVLNAIFSAFSPLALLIMKENPQFVVVNPATTLTVFSVLYAVGMILGGIFATTVCKDSDLFVLLRWLTLFPVLIFLGFYLQQIYVLLLILFVNFLFLAVFNPKMIALIMNELPEDKLATLQGGITTLCQIGRVAAQAVVAALVVLVSSQTISLIFIVLSLLLLIHTVRKFTRKGV